MSLDNVTVAILAGGDSSRFGSEKSLALFHGKPLVTHMVPIAKVLASRVIVVASSDEQQVLLTEMVPGIDIVIDVEGSERSALNGSVTAFEYSNNDYTLLLPVDTPLASKGLLKSILQLRDGHGAVIPAWPNGYVEPLHAVYLTEHAYDKGLEVLETGQRRMKDLLNLLTNVLYVQTEILRMFDENLDTFSNVNTVNELKQLENERSGT